MKALEAAEKPVMGSEVRCSFQIFLQHFCLTYLILTVCHWEMGGDGGVYSFWAGWLNQRGVAPRYLKLCHNRQRSLFLTGVQRWLWNLEWSRGHSVMGETMWKRVWHDDDGHQRESCEPRYRLQLSVLHPSCSSYLTRTPWEPLIQNDPLVPCSVSDSETKTYSKRAAVLNWMCSAVRWLRRSKCLPHSLMTQNSETARRGPSPESGPLIYMCACYMCMYRYTPTLNIILNVEFFK